MVEALININFANAGSHYREPIEEYHPLPFERARLASIGWTHSHATPWFPHLPPTVCTSNLSRVVASRPRWTR